jgi:hypothetical protein
LLPVVMGSDADWWRAADDTPLADRIAQLQAALLSWSELYCDERARARALAADNERLRALLAEAVKHSGRRPDTSMIWQF